MCQAIRYTSGYSYFQSRVSCGPVSFDCGECVSIIHAGSTEVLLLNFSSTRPSTREFLASVSSCPIESDEIDLDFEKLKNHRFVEKDDVPFQSNYKEGSRSVIAQALLKRWLHR